MKNALSKFKYYILAAVATLGLCAGAFSFTDAKAATAANAELCLPYTAMEYYELSSPIDSFLWGGNAAIVQDDKTLRIYNGGSYTSVDLFNLPKQVKVFSDTQLLVSDNGTIYTLDYANPTVKAALFDDDNSVVGGNYFDIKNGYLLTAYSSGIHLYGIGSGGSVTQHALKKTITVDASAPVCLSDNDEIFYIKQSIGYEIRKYSIADGDDLLIESKTGAKPTAMAVLDGYLYYSQDADICRVSTEGGVSQIMTVPQSDYELGNILSPSGICVKDGKLIITDAALNAVQEFSVEEDGSLCFTGFAIAKGKTAFNRLSNSAYIVEKNDKTILAVDQNKITVTDTVTNQFKNYPLIADFALTNVALGSSQALMTNGSALKILNLLDGEVKDIVIESLSGVTDLYYQNGYYLVTANDGFLTNVYKIDQKTATPSLLLTHNGVTSLGVADNLGNIYLSDVDGNFTLYYPDGAAYGVKTFNMGVSGIQKLSVDICGGLYALSNGSIWRYDGVAATDYTVSCAITTAPVKDMAMDGITDEAYLIFEGEEIIAKTVELDNASQSDYITQTLYKPLTYVSSLSQSQTLAPQKAYITTNVNAYYLPLITKNGEFSMTDVEIIRLQTGAIITPLSRIVFDGNAFYLSDVTFNGNTYQGYVPANFTVTVLSEDINKVTFTVGQVNKTDVHRTAELNDGVYSLKDKENIKIFWIENGVAKIAYQTDGEWLEGYISADQIIQTPNTVIRNVLIIIAVVLSLSVTSIFFMYRRRG